jgi:hypothetical protein
MWKWDTPTTTIVVSKWLDNTLPWLRVWIPLVVHSFVLPIQLLLLAVLEDEPGMFEPPYRQASHR